MAQKVRDVEEINARLAEIGQEILPEGLSLVYVEMSRIREQDLNARTMPKKMFEQLIANVRGVGALESVPLLVKQDEQLAIISGHHRVRAARAAGLTHLLCFVYATLPKARIKAKQLAHNSLEGKDDPEIVKRIWEQIDDVAAQFESFIDPRLFDAIPEPVTFSPVDIDLKNSVKAVLILFLPIQKVDFDAAIEDVLPATGVDVAYLANRETYDQWVAALQRVRNELDIASIPTAVAEMARLASEALDVRLRQAANPATEVV